MTKKIIIASKNKGKITELNSILQDIPVDIQSMELYGINDDIEESGTDLSSNALIKARYIYHKTKLPVISDDSGLFVDALHGAPGIYSARYAGLPSDSQRNIDKLMTNMEGIVDRKAHFAAVICYIDELGNESLFEGKIYGTIAVEMSGNKGFGYDPIFIPDGYSKTFAEIDDDIKNRISHRARAMQSCVAFLKAQVIK